MPLQYAITHVQSLIKVTVSGTPDYLSLDRLWRDITAACMKHECFAILGQSNTDGWTADDAYDHADIFEAAGVSNQYRIAWVEDNPRSRDTIKLAEAVVRHGGLKTGRTFDSVREAKLWLAQ